jgi:hypothetical protein
MCLDADLGNGANGTKVQLWHCNGWANQQWYFRYPSAAVQSGWGFPYGKCLDADYHGSPNGAKVQLWDCNQTAEQDWNYHS